MNGTKFSRRGALTRAGALLGSAALLKNHTAMSAEPKNPSAGDKPFLFCLNTATIRGQKLGIVKEIELASAAGYDAIEPWIESIDQFVKSGGKLPELKQRVNDAGLTVESAIGFPQWIVNDEQRRAKGLEQAKREMEMVTQIGGKRLAAPPAGATDAPGLDLLEAAKRYRALLEIGDGAGVIPQLELWGFSQNLNRLGECVCVAIETAHPKACVLADIYHLYKGGSDYRGIHLLGPTAIEVLHMNDYPANPPREKIDDSYRVFPGDGVAPVVEILRALHRCGGQKVLSLEIFNRKYWAKDPLEVIKQGLSKMKALASQV
jgi:sugar phosphate isomerase/epimerase